jgi:hypothetical protein
MALCNFLLFACPQEEWGQYVNVALHAVEEGVGLDVDSKSPLVTVLSYTPKILVHSQQ